MNEHSLTEYEHIKVKGDVVEIGHVDVSTLRGDTWEKIDQAIQDFTRLHPNYMRLFLMENARDRAEQANSLASTKDKSLRLGASVPPALYYKLLQIEPDLFTSKKLFHAFMKRYKGFRIAETV